MRSVDYTPRTELRNIRNANFPKDGYGRTYHTSTMVGDIANRVVTVGSHARAQMISELFDTVEVEVTSDRGFVTHTGMLRGTPITVVATGMGLPMVDMMVREVNSCVDGNMLFLRLGTCGTPNVNVPLGAVTLNDQCVLITRNYDAWMRQEMKNDSGQTEKHYKVSRPIQADKALTCSLKRELEKRIKDVRVGLSATCDSFYGSQGRQDPWFLDYNENLIDELMKQYPNAVTFEMETGHLFHLAKIARRRKIRAGGCAIVLAQRHSNGFLSKAETKRMERDSAIAVVEALITTPLYAGDPTVAEPLEAEILRLATLGSGWGQRKSGREEKGFVWYWRETGHSLH